MSWSRPIRDCSNPYVKQFIEIPPFAKDPNNPVNFLNETDQIILKENGRINIQDYIDSFADSCDFAMLFDQFMKTQDFTILNQREGVYEDISQIPDNYNDMVAYLDHVRSDFNDLDYNQQQVALSLLNIDPVSLGLNLKDKPIEEENVNG